MLKIDSRDKERMKMLCANRRLYVFPPGDLYFAPSRIRFRRNGTVQGYERGAGWRSLWGAEAIGPCLSDLWTF